MRLGRIGGLGWREGEAAERLRERTPAEWWAHADEVDEAGMVVWDDLMYLPYMAQELPLELLPPGVASEIGQSIIEAAMDTGLDGIVDFCRQLVPAVDAIDRWARA